ncbi:MAG: C45 family peptidase [Actinomycetota bacterium]|nr:C45 family peptidase [Actinomycetota bacterium]
MSLRVVHVEGDGQRRGLQAGVAMADLIHRSLGFYRRFLRRRGVTPEDLPRRLEPHRDAAKAAYPDLVDEIAAMARGAGVEFWELFAANAWEELEPALEPVPAPADRCTGVVVGTPEGGTVLAHDEQWYAGDAGCVAVVVARPDDGPAFVSPTVASFLPAVGMNASGMAQSVMSLTADDDRVGIPRLLVSRSALQAADREDAVRRATVEGRAGGYAHLFAGGGGGGGGEAFVVETSATDHRVLDGVTGHTNHYLDPDLAKGDGNHGPGTRTRLARARELAAASSTVDDAMAILHDHQAGALSICAHPQERDGDEAESILFAMVCHVEEGRMWVAPGNPCITPFTEIDVRAALGRERAS